MNVIVFSLRECHFAVEASLVREVLASEVMTPLPPALSLLGMVGASHVRGKVLPVIDVLELLTGDSATEVAETCLRVSSENDEALFCASAVEELAMIDDAPVPLDAEQPVFRELLLDGLEVCFVDVSRLWARLHEMLAELRQDYSTDVEPSISMDVEAHPGGIDDGR